jgi:hypothetical protein
VGDTLPQGAGEQLTVQVTLWLLRSLPTFAISGAVVVSMTSTLVGCIVTVMAATVTVAVATDAGSATDAAFTVTARSLAGGAGAV